MTGAEAAALLRDAKVLRFSLREGSIDDETVSDIEYHGIDEKFCVAEDVPDHIAGLLAASADLARTVAVLEVALIRCRAESKWAGHGATVQGLALHAVGDIVEAAFVEVSK